MSPGASTTVLQWCFLEYKGPTDKLPVSAWWKRLSPTNKAKAGLFLRRVMASLEESNRPQEQDFRKFVGKKNENLWEARWRGENNVPHRIFCDPLGESSLTFLCGCTHKQQRYTPQNASNTAVKRSKELQRSEATAHEFTFWSVE